MLSFGPKHAYEICIYIVHVQTYQHIFSNFILIEINKQRLKFITLCFQKNDYPRHAIRAPFCEFLTYCNNFFWMWFIEVEVLNGTRVLSATDQPRTDQSIWTHAILFLVKVLNLDWDEISFLRSNDSKHEKQIHLAATEPQVKYSNLLRALGWNYMFTNFSFLMG